MLPSSFVKMCSEKKKTTQDVSVAITKHHSLVANKQQKFTSHISGVWKSKIKALADSWFMDSVFSLCPHKGKGDSLGSFL